MPMATPISAFFRAGASFTPSPVMATISPLACRASTMRTLCSGATRAKTLTSSRRSSSSWSEAVSSTRPLTTLSRPGTAIPISRAMARAVSSWSPVIMITLMPAVRHFLTASTASLRGASIMPTRPRKVNSFSMADSSSGTSVTSRTAIASTRRARPAISLFLASRESAVPLSRSWSLSLTRRLVHRGTTLSAAPFMKAIFLPSTSWTVVILFLTESKASSNMRGECLNTSPSSMPALRAVTIRVPSVGSPRTFHLPSSW
ncbi:MAG: hypothetical protein A4E30_00012 [Methanomassiliicoccales archaeon PtaB.Bin215]|nr:MAG: hypothetical protein A4E30_00012 [Methanomassiliicoccales archaeon PtaB.Bin215]